MSRNTSGRPRTLKPKELRFSTNLVLRFLLAKNKGISRILLSRFRRIHNDRFDAYTLLLLLVYKVDRAGGGLDSVLSVYIYDIYIRSSPRPLRIRGTRIPRGGLVTYVQFTVIILSQKNVAPHPFKFPRHGTLSKRFVTVKHSFQCTWRYMYSDCPDEGLSSFPPESSSNHHDGIPCETVNVVPCGYHDHHRPRDVDDDDDSPQWECSYLSINDEEDE